MDAKYFRMIQDTKKDASLRESLTAEIKVVPYGIPFTDLDHPHQMIICEQIANGDYDHAS
jgi:hypothetical protein